MQSSSQLRESIRTEGVYDVDTLIAAIPAAEKREEEEYRAALADVMDPSVDDSVVPAFTEEEPAPLSFTVTWMSEGQVLRTDTVEEGETPVYSGQTPAKDTDAQKTYTFTGWTPQPGPATGDVTYTAVFEATYDFDAIIPQGTNSSSYWVYFPTEGNTPITTAKEGETFTFYVAGGDSADFTVRLNGVVLGGESFYYDKERDAFVCTFTVPKDPVIEIEPAN